MKENNKVLILISLLGFSAVFSIVFKWIQTGDPFSQQTLLYGILIFLNLAIPLTIAYAIFRRYTSKSLSELRKIIIPAVVLFALGILFIQLIMISFGVYIYFLVNGIDTSGFINHLLSVEIPGALKQFAVWIMVGSAAFFYFIWRRATDAEQKLREENLKHRYKNLKSQVRPHFLFNSLNTLSELVYDDPGKADRYIQKLSDI